MNLIIQGPNDRLRDAAERGDLPAMRAALAEGASDLNTALLKAAKHGHVEALEELIRQGADLLSNGESAIKNAVHGEHLEIVFALARHGNYENVIAEAAKIASVGEKEDFISALLGIEAEPKDLLREAAEILSSKKMKEVLSTSSNPSAWKTLDFIINKHPLERENYRKPTQILLRYLYDKGELQAAKINGPPIDVSSELVRAIKRSSLAKRPGGYFAWRFLGGSLIGLFFKVILKLICTSIIIVFKLIIFLFWVITVPIWGPFKLFEETEE